MNRLHHHYFKNITTAFLSIKYLDFPPNTISEWTTGNEPQAEFDNGTDIPPIQAPPSPLHSRQYTHGKHH